MKLLPLLLILLFLGCTSKPFEINLMPAPELFVEEQEAPVSLDSLAANRASDHRGVLYVTSREPQDNITQFPHFSEQNAFILRAGRATAKFTDENLNIMDLENASHDSTLNGKYKITLDSIYPLGVIPHSAHPLVVDAQRSKISNPSDSAFLHLLKQRVAHSPRKSITIFTHGYRVDFSYPVLIARQLAYFSGLQETYIAFSWPSTYKKYLAYFQDSETAMTSGRDMRILIEYLAEQSGAKEINIIGHSAGTRVILQAVNELALLNSHLSHEELQKKYKINNIILLSGDASLQHLLGFPEGGATNLSKRLTLYQSEQDKALNTSFKLQKHYRVGQAISANAPQPKDSLLIAGIKGGADRLNIINATAALDATEGNGHSYFWKSPWVSSDLIMLLRYDMPASKRGLSYNEAWGTWEFDVAYPEKLLTAVEDHNTKATAKGHTKKKL